MADIFKALVDTPLATLLVIFGFIMLSVGFGLRVTVVIDVDNINKTYAKIIGSFLLLVGIIPYVFNTINRIMGQKSGFTDPFLCAGIFLGVILNWRPK